MLFGGRLHRRNFDASSRNRECGCIVRNNSHAWADKTYSSLHKQHHSALRRWCSRNQGSFARNRFTVGGRSQHQGRTASWWKTLTLLQRKTQCLYPTFLFEREWEWFYQFKTKLLLDEAGNGHVKGQLISDIVKSISLIPDQIIRAVYIKDCSRLLEVDERVLINAINKHILNDLRKEECGFKFSPFRNTAYGWTARKGKWSSDIIRQFLCIPPNWTNTSGIFSIMSFGTEIYLWFRKRKKQNLKNSIPTVIEYVKFDLERDSLQIQNPLFRKIVELWND